MGASIVGISLLRNEDLYIETVLRNAMEFCDKIIVADHMSSDQTWEIVQDLSSETEKLECVRIRQTEESHELIAGYAGTETWIFGVDGDEIYDPAGLAVMRREILDGRYDAWWQIYGNVLNCVALDRKVMTADGFLAPPCRSMVKLYNFGAITEWRGPCKERLHGDQMVFRDGYSLADRLHLHQQVSWEHAHLRCLHLCFLPRSSTDNIGSNGRENIMEKAGKGFWIRVLGSTRAARSDYKREKYTRGERVTKDIDAFFRETVQD